MRRRPLLYSASVSGRLAPALGFAALVAAIGCGSGEPGGSGQPAATPAQPAAAQTASAPKADASARAKQIFETRCATCHGMQGAGDGPGSAALTPTPRNFQDAAWQDSVSDDHIAKILSYGGAAVGKSPAMPGNPDLIAQPEVVAALVAHVRSLRAK